MSGYLLPYSVGTVSVTNASKTVTGALTTWADNVKPGDLFEGPDGRFYAISAAAISNTSFELIDEYQGSTATEQAYKVHRVSPGWGATSDINLRVANLMNALRRNALTSNTEVEIDTGEKVFTVQAGFPIGPGARVTIANPAAPENLMNGVVIAYEGTSLTIDVETTGGSGTFSDWAINFAGSPGPQGVQGEQGPKGDQGDQGPKGDKGDKGDTGDKGWSPVFAIVADGDRRVLQVEDWVGGEGTPPEAGDYVGADGLVDDINDAVDIRGPKGQDGAGVGTVTQIDTGGGLAGGPITSTGTIAVDIIGQTEETEPADDDVFLMQLADGSAFRKVKAANLPGSGGGTVTQIDTGDGLTGGPITNSGTISIDLSGLDEETEPASDDLFLLQKASDGSVCKVKAANLPGSGGGGGADVEALFFDQRMTTLMLAEFTKQPIFIGPDGSAIHDPFDTLAYVDVAGATNLDTSEAGVLQPTRSVNEIDRTAGSNIGDLIEFGGLSAAFDGVTSAAANQNAAITSGRNAWVGKTLAAPAAISHVYVYGSNNQGFVYAINPTVTITLYGKTGAAPSSGTDGTPLGAITFTDTANESAGRKIDSSDLSTEWDHVWIYISHNGAANAINCAELQLFSGVVNDVEVASEPIATSEVPAWGRLIAIIESAAVLGTDILFDFSRDGGSTWAACTMSEPFNQPDGRRVLDSGIVDVTAQPSDTYIAWRARTANGKLVKIHAIAMWAGV